MNAFDQLCELASNEKWCWNLFCTTCGHMHFRYAFAELAAGKSPSDANWLIHSKSTHFSKRLGPLPKSYSEDQKAQILSICLDSDIEYIAQHCQFPDWLGYLGLILEHMVSDSNLYQEVSQKWASQLQEFVNQDSDIYSHLQQIIDNNGVLSINVLQNIESESRATLAT